MENKELIYYNYILLDPRYKGDYYINQINIKFKPFYVGKGKKNRVKYHYQPKQDGSNLAKELIIQECKNGGYLPKYIVFNKNSSEQSALDLERKLIKYINVKYPGCLTNIQEGGKQPPVRYGIDNNKSRKIYMYNGTSGIFEKEFDCIADACKYLNISVDNVSHICDCCSGKRYSCAKHLWNYNKYEKLF